MRANLRVIFWEEFISLDITFKEMITILGNIEPCIWYIAMQETLSVCIASSSDWKPLQQNLQPGRKLN